MSIDTAEESRAFRIAVLDDYQRVARSMADWSAVESRAEVEVFDGHWSEPQTIIEALSSFDAVCVMRERTPLNRQILERLPRLKVIASTGPRNASIDEQAAKERGIAILHTGYNSRPTIELTWALILSSTRRITEESASVRRGGWQTGVGSDLHGRTLGILGLGRIGSEVARIGKAFGMEVIAWSQNLTAETASASGARLVSKDELFAASDVVSVHLILSERSRGLVGRSELSKMKRSAFIINTSRGPIIDETALLEALTAKSIAGAALDVFDVEPLPARHPFRSLENVIATPHVGYVAQDLYRVFFQDTVSNLAEWLDRRGG